MADEVSKKVRGRPFPKGVSGNPKGRAPDPPEFRLRLREGDTTALDVLEQAMRGKKVPWTSRIRAAELWLAYSNGKPKQTFEIAGKNGAAIAMQAAVLQVVLTDETSSELLDQAAARAAQLAREPGGDGGAFEPGPVEAGQAPGDAVALAGGGNEAEATAAHLLDATAAREE